jgi:FtsZ-binding cell division protein ZapB
VKAHELATLNEYKEENAELKRTCEGLRKRNEALTTENIEVAEQRDKAETIAEGLKAGLGALYQAILHIGGSSTLRCSDSRREGHTRRTGERFKTEQSYSDRSGRSAKTHPRADSVTTESTPAPALQIGRAKPGVHPSANCEEESGSPNEHQ